MSSITALQNQPGFNPGIRPDRVPDTEIPNVVWRQYRAEINKRILKPAHDLILAELLPLIPELVRSANLADSLTVDLDDWADQLTRVMEGLRFAYGRRISDAEVRALVKDRYNRTYDVNKDKNLHQLHVLYGIDVLRDPDLAGLAAGFTTTNVNLIKSIPADYFKSIEELVLTNVRKGRRASVIQKEVMARYGVIRSKAELIARDQTAKLNAEITEQRHKELGIASYLWRTSQDDRVRMRHRELGAASDNGKVYQYKKPPVVDPKTGRRENPGGDYQCRCTAEPWIPGIDNKRKAGPKTRRAQPKPKKAQRHLLPSELPKQAAPDYSGQTTSPSGPFDPRKILGAFKKGAATPRKLTKKQQIAWRQQLNNLNAESKLANRDLINVAARESEKQTRDLLDNMQLGNATPEETIKELHRLGESFVVDGDVSLESNATKAANNRLTRIRAMMNTKRSGAGSEHDRLSFKGNELNRMKAAAYHSTDTGEIATKRGILGASNSFLSSPPERWNPPQVQSFHVMVHESVHGHSHFGPGVYKGIGAKLEEATTELAARELTEKVAGGWKITNEAASVMAEKKARGGYRDLVQGLTNAVQKGLGGKIDAAKASKIARKASLDMRKHAGDVIDSEEGYLHHFARQLPRLKAKVAKAEKAAAADFDDKLRRARTDNALAKRLTGHPSSKLDSPFAQPEIEAERKFRIDSAGRAVTKAIREELRKELATRVM